MSITQLLINNKQKPVLPAVGNKQARSCLSLHTNIRALSGTPFLPKGTEEKLVAVPDAAYFLPDHPALGVFRYGNEWRVAHNMGIVGYSPSELVDAEAAAICHGFFLQNFGNVLAWAAGAYQEAMESKGWLDSNGLNDQVFQSKKDAVDCLLWYLATRKPD